MAHVRKNLAVQVKWTEEVDLQLILDSMGVYPAYVVCPRWDIVAWNRADCQVYADFSTMSPRERILPWFLLIDRRPRTQLVDWEAEAQRTLALFRASTQHYVGEAWLTELITELKQASPEFREWWPRHDVQEVHTEQTHLNHPLVGMLTMKATTFRLADHPDLQMIVYTPVSGTDTLAKLTDLSVSGSRLQFLKAI